VLWFRIGRREQDPREFFGLVNYGQALVLINRGEYFQAGLIILKGSFDEIKIKGLEEFRSAIARMAPFLADRTEQLNSWDNVKLLSVQINRLPQWYRRGLLLIGDAAHAMSPAGGVGINLAIQDAVATARILGGPLRAGSISEKELARVQCRREFPARVIQAMQVKAHQGFAAGVAGRANITLPWQLRALLGIPGFQRAAGYFIGVGVRPEHVEPRSARPAIPIAAIAAACSAAIAVVLILRKR